MQYVSSVALGLSMTLLKSSTRLIGCSLYCLNLSSVHGPPNLTGGESKLAGTWMQCVYKNMQTDIQHILKRQSPFPWLPSPWFSPLWSPAKGCCPARSTSTALCAIVPQGVQAKETWVSDDFLLKLTPTILMGQVSKQESVINVTGHKVQNQRTSLPARSRAAQSK